MTWCHFNFGFASTKRKRTVLFCPPSPIQVSLCYQLPSFGRPPPSPSSDDVIYEQPLISRNACRLNLTIGAVGMEMKARGAEGFLTFTRKWLGDSCYVSIQNKHSWLFSWNIVENVPLANKKLPHKRWGFSLRGLQPRVVAKVFRQPVLLTLSTQTDRTDLIFVICSPQMYFWAQFFSIWKFATKQCE